MLAIATVCVDISFVVGILSEVTFTVAGSRISQEVKLVMQPSLPTTVTTGVTAFPRRLR